MNSVTGLAPMVSRLGSGRRGTVFVATVLIAVALSACVVYFPWETRLRVAFPDRDAYLESTAALIESGATYVDSSAASLLSLLLNEFLWREILIFVGTVFRDASDGLAFVSLIAATLTVYQVVRKAGVAYAGALLLSPLAVDLFLSQIRSALALGIFLSALAARGKTLKYLLFALAFFIHSFAAVLFAIYKYDEFVLGRSGLSSRVKIGAALCFGATASAIWAFLANLIFSLLGDRRASYDAILPVSIPFALWWVLEVGVLMAFARLRRREEDGQFVLLAVILLALFVFSTAFGAGGLRFLSLSLPFVYVAIRTIREPVIRAALLAGTLVFNGVDAFFWLR